VSAVVVAVKAFLAQAKEDFNKKWEESAQVQYPFVALKEQY